MPAVIKREDFTMSMGKLSTWRQLTMLTLLACLSLTGCFHHKNGGGLLGRGAAPPYDRPFPIGQVPDAFWETQQTNAEAADFVFYDHEFVAETAEFTPGAKRHLESVALRMEHGPFPIVIEMSTHDAKRELDQTRRVAIVEQLARMGVPNSADRVIIAPAFAEGFTAVEAERAYSATIGSGGSFSGGSSRGGGSYR